MPEPAVPAIEHDPLRDDVLTLKADRHASRFVRQLPPIHNP
jgi:hypothetical protein